MRDSRQTEMIDFITKERFSEIGLMSTAVLKKDKMPDYAAYD